MEFTILRDKVGTRSEGLRLRQWSDGSYAVSGIDRARGRYALVESDGKGIAHVVEVAGDSWTELTLARPLYAKGLGLSEVAARGSLDGAFSRTEDRTFPGGARRRDEDSLRGNTIVRNSRWEYPSGRSAEAIYTSDGRAKRAEIIYRDRDGEGILGRAVVLTSRGDSIYVTETTLTDGGGGVTGSSRTTTTNETSVETSGSLDGSTSITTRQDASGRTVSSTIRKTEYGPDGTTVTETTVGEGYSSTSTTYTTVDSVKTTTRVLNDDGSGSLTVTRTTDSGNGSTTTTTDTAVFGPDGKATSVTDTIVVQNDDGSMRGSSVTEGGDGSTTSRSAWGQDAAGNSSETTIEYDPEGGFTITTTSVDASGQGSTVKDSYDKDGNQTDHSETSGSGGGGGGDDDSGGGDDDGSGGDDGGGDDGSMPSDDGTDEGPKRRGGFGHRSLDDLLKGVGGSDDDEETGPRIIADLHSSLTKWVVGGGGSGGGADGWGDAGSEEKPRLILDHAVGGHDTASGEDFIHPQALVGIAQQFFGMARTAAMSSLVEKDLSG